MKKRTFAVGCVVTLVLAGAVVFWRDPARWSAAAPSSAATRGTPAVSVDVASAIRKMNPVRVAALGNVAPIASVALKPRIDSEITGVHFADGAVVRQGDVLVTLDNRAIAAQILQAEGNVARDEAQVEGAERDLRRYTELVSKSATPVTNLDNAKTQVAVFAAAKKADEAQLANLKVQLSYTTIHAPISGRISAAAVKVGNFVRSADIAPIATIIQTAPIYVNFAVPQASLPDIRTALAAETATVAALIPGETRQAEGAVTMIENTVDPGTGMVMLRATMPNKDELLWPGTLVTAQLTLREEEAVVVPSAAIQVGQSGAYVFVVADNAAKVQPVQVARVIGHDTVLASGLNGGESVVTDGHLLLNNGSRVTLREKRPGV